jgi:hypothetical protein
MHHSVCSDFSLARLGSSDLELSSRGMLVFHVAYSYSYQCLAVKISMLSVTSSEERFGVVSAITTPAHHFGSGQFEVERSFFVGGRGGYSVTLTGGSGSHRILVIFDERSVE